MKKFTLSEVDEWRKEWKEFSDESRSPAEVLAGLWARLSTLPTPLGRFAVASMLDETPPEPDSKPQRGDDLFPMDPKAVADFLGDHEWTVTDSVLGMVTALNFLASPEGKGGWLGGFSPRSLTQAQKFTVAHLVDHLLDLEESRNKVSTSGEGVAKLQSVKFDYMGEPVVPMEDIQAELVIAAWPKVGEAAIQEAVECVPEPMKKMLLSPEKCLKPVYEWPSKPHSSKVRASDEEWTKIVRAGHERGLMVPVEPTEVFCDSQGVPVLNGCGAVPKWKKIEGQEMKLQRFISNLIPANEFQDRIEGDDVLLPYLGQLTLLEQGSSEIWLVDSEDFTSCFNLFRLPPCWHKYMAFGKLVDAEVFGGKKGHQVYAAMNVLPMGWISSVAVIQTIVRSLVFTEAEVPETSEIAKTKAIPADGDLTVIYLDSFDQLRRLDASCEETLQGKPSKRHQRFLQVCKDRGLPLNEAKRLVASTKGSLQGGELDGKKGLFGLAKAKMADVIGLGSSLLAMDEWSEFALRRFVGKATFGMCFRRPLFSVLQALFDEIQDTVAKQKSKRPHEKGIDEVILVSFLTPLMVSNLKAKIDPEVSVTDASPSGGGAAVATAFAREPCTFTPEANECDACRRSLETEALVFPCPALCGARFCSLGCIADHRKSERGCLRKSWLVPKFGERFAGKRAPLSHAVAQNGTVEVQPPFDLHFGDDFFSLEGRTKLQALMDDPLLAAEHWAPECKLFSRARGKPLYRRDGTRVPGPQPVRDQRHIMGFPNLSPNMKAKVRQANNMVLKAFKRAKQPRPERTSYFSMEHPYRSWAWEFSLAKELEAIPEFTHSVGSSCCFGGDREKWFSFFSDMPNLQEFLQKDCPGHANLLDYTPVERPDGTFHFPTEEEAEYPWELCKAYATALHEQLTADGLFDECVLEAREAFYLGELQQSTARLAEPLVCAPMSALLARVEQNMVEGDEAEHLHGLLRRATYRGTDVRFFSELRDGDSVTLHEQPYLAMRWQWKTVLAYPWKAEGHINELELLAVAVFLKRRGRNVDSWHRRFFHILDSMVSRGVLAKGRSSSRRLNGVARRCSAHLLAMDNYMFPPFPGGTSPTSPHVFMRRKLSLKFAGLHPRTLRAYRTALDRFLKFTRKSKLPVKKPSQLDQQLAEFIDNAYQDGEPISYAGHLLSAIKRFHPPLRLALPTATQFFRNWQRCYTPSRAIPASWELVEAMMGVALHKGQFTAALLFALGFHCMLRTSELLALSHRHVLLHRVNSAASIIIPGSKTSQGNPQVILVEDVKLVSFAAAIISSGSGALLWSTGAHRFRAFFASCLEECGFGPQDYTPYSLRRGGSTWWFQASLSLDLVVARGRWQCSKTARQYIDEGTCQLAHVQWSRRQRRLVAHWRDHCGNFRLRQQGKKRKR